MINAYGRTIYELWINGEKITRSAKKKELEEVAYAEAHSIFNNNKVELVDTETGEVLYY